MRRLHRRSNCKPGMPDRAAFTLVELMVSVAIISVIMGGVAGTIMFSARQMADSAEAETRSFNTCEILAEINAELALALSVERRDDDAVTLTVPDRNGDGAPETIAYEWQHDDPDSTQWTLVRTYNDGEAAVVAEDVRHFELTYRLRTVEPR